MKKLLGGLLGGLGLLLAGGAGFVATFSPAQRGALDVKAPTDAASVEYGEYLANHVLGCMECHSARDWERYGGPIKGALGAGGDCYDEREGLPGKVCAPNITPHASGIGKWTDGELLRAIREGVDREGEALFPMMPYREYRHLSDKDALAVIAYLRSLKPIDRHPGETKISFPVSFFIKLEPQPLNGPVDSVEHGSPGRGEYLTRVGGCVSCHTAVDEQHHPLPDKTLAGGQVFENRFFKVTSPNLTPHAQGLKMTKEAFVARIQGSTPESAPKVPKSENTVMPWLGLSGMKSEDLESIYSYLKSVPAIPTPEH